MGASRTQAFFVASTHWDREWYEPFQHFRYHLVEVIDEVLAVMARDERFACFQTDGQSILVEDYLEIRPEREDEVMRLARAGRLRVGPWYTMPDENLVAPESLIRNLEEGIRVARDYGGVSKAGFSCDIFGHVSQLPQIFRGFGIDNAFLFRGVNEDTHGGCFRWQGADGSEIVVLRFGPRDGYFDYAANVRRGFEPEARFDLKEGIERLAEYVKIQRERLGLDTILLFDGGDHMPIEPQTGDLLDGLRQACPDVDVRHTGLDEFAAALAARRSEITRTATGELREPGRLDDGVWLIPGVLSSRIRLTQSNRARETELCFWAEPFSHLAGCLAGREYPHGFLRRSWRYLLENHAHDSICGCSPDQVHKDMEFRFDQSRLINQKLIDDALASIAVRVDLPDLEDEDFAMVVFNPTPADMDGPVDLELWFDEKTKKLYGEFFRYEWKVGFRLYDDQDNELRYDYLRYAPQRRRFHRVYRRVPMGQECIVVTVSVPLTIPAFGYTTLTCKPVDRPTRHPAGRMVTGDRTLESDHLRVEVQSNGSLRLEDKRTGQVYDRLLVFEERADIGDGWYHGVAVNDEIHTSTAAAAAVAVVENGAFKATLRVSVRMEVPARFEFGTKMGRSGEKADVVIDNYVTLRPDADHVEIRTVIDNQVRDHRVRVLFETGADTGTYLADSAFDVVEREIGLPPDNHTYKELAVETAPQANWTAVFDAGRGLAVVGPGLPETAACDVPQRTLALTLLRGFRRTIFTDGEEGGQSLGHHEFRYCVVPLAGPPSRTKLAMLAQRMAAGTRAVQVLARDQAERRDRLLPRKQGMLALQDGRLVLSSFRRHPQRGYVELRLFNPHEEPVMERVRYHRPLSSACLVDLEGDEVGSLPVSGGGVQLGVPAKKIITVALTEGDRAS